MTLYGEPRVWLEQFPEGQTSTVDCTHLGLTFPGEVIRAASWSPSWGEPLDQDVYFRIVLLSRRSANLQPGITDARIAVCLPGATSSRRRSNYVGELATIRETQAMYMVSRDTEADLIRTTLRRRQDELEQDLLGEESVRYSHGTIGTITTATGSPIDASEIFAGIDPVQWFQRLAGRLLDGAYPAIPVDTSSLNRSVTLEDVPDLHRAIFNQPGAKPEVLCTLGPALGLSSHATPGEFDASNCQVFNLLREWISRQQGPADWNAAHHHLAHEIGLTGPLARLYLLNLLIFVHTELPPVEITLTSIDNVTTVDGKPLLTGRLTRDLIPLIAWNPDMAKPGASIRQESEPVWEDVLQHLSYLSPDLATHVHGGDMPAAQAVLAGDIASLSQELTQCQGLLAQLHQESGEPLPPHVSDPLERLSAVLGEAPAGFAAVYRRIRTLYPNPALIENDISCMHGLADIAGIAPMVLDLMAYLEGAEIPDSTMPALSLERRSLRAALLLGNLIRRPGRSWESLRQEIEGFKTSYGAAYRSHHAQFHQDLLGYRRDLEAARTKSQAISLLNIIPEFSSVEDSALAQSLAQLDNSPAPCSVEGESLELENDPVCGSCGITLEQSLPLGELSRISSAIEANLAGQNRQLSNLLVGKIMQEAHDPQLDDLLKIVQASDLSALSNTLTPDMVGFIRRLLV